LAADIAGYSALMGSDEAGTVRDLKGHQAVVLPMIGEFGGRIIDTAGDGILAEFSSVVNASKDREAYSGLHRVWVIIEGAASYHAYPFTVSAAGKFTANGTRRPWSQPASIRCPSNNLQPIHLIYCTA
jgi:class 3 adenylate cyclase